MTQISHLELQLIDISFLNLLLELQEPFILRAFSLICNIKRRSTGKQVCAVKASDSTILESVYLTLGKRENFTNFRLKGQVYLKVTFVPNI